MPASRARLASSSGADFTSSRSWRIMPPMRITFAGCSTRSVMLGSADSPSSLAMEPGPMTTTCGSSGVPSGCCVMPPPYEPASSGKGGLCGEDDLPGVLAGLHDPVGLGDLLQRQGGVHQGPHGAVGDQWPDVLD